MSAMQAASGEVAEAFVLGGITSPVVLVARGQQGRVWRFETTTGRYAVKELLVPLSEEAAALDVAMVAEMRSRGIHAPEPVPTVGETVLARVRGALVRAYTWVDLEEPDTDVDPVAVGVLLGTLHRDPIPARTPVDPWYVAPVAEDLWYAAADELARASAPFAQDFRDDIPRCLALQALYREPGRTQLCHRDLWADNLRRDRTGHLCAVDWENCGAADPAQELACLLVEFCYGQPMKARALYSAYRRAGGTGTLTDRGDFTMALAQFGHFAVTAAGQWLAAEDDDTRSRAEAWFREGLDRPLDIDRIDKLLTACR